MVQFSERALDYGDFHEAVLQGLDERVPRADAHRRAGLVPGDLKFAQMVWRRSPGLGMCGRLTGVSPRPGTQLRPAQRSSGIKGRFIDGTAQGGWRRDQHDAVSLLPQSGWDNSSETSRTEA